MRPPDGLKHRSAISMLVHRIILRHAGQYPVAKMSQFFPRLLRSSEKAYFNTFSCDDGSYILKKRNWMDIDINYRQAYDRPTAVSSLKRN
jgi:hypothetical protein